MIECPKCGHENMIGSAFCIDCGVMFLASGTPMAQDRGLQYPSDEAMPMPSPISSAVAPSDTWATLHLLENGQLVHLAARNEFTIGRVAAGQPITPDIDLTSYGAHSRGLSRLHAVITRGIDHIFLRDLDSANGTFVNGRRLQPNEEFALSNGDVVALGGLKVRILLQSP